MTKRGTWSRRDVVAGLAGLAGAGFSGIARAQPAAGQPIRIGQTLSLTGPFAQTGLVHQITSEIFVEQLNQKGGLLGRPVEYVLLDDQSKPDVARTLYERLITSDKVDLILGPYGTAAILAAMGVAARYKKVFIQNTMGTPQLATYEWHFSAHGRRRRAEQDPAQHRARRLCEHRHIRPRRIFIVTTKFPSAMFMAGGTQRRSSRRASVKAARPISNTMSARAISAPIAARVKDADPDLMWVGCLGVEGNQLLEALATARTTSRSGISISIPSSGPLAVLPAAEGAVSITNFEDVGALQPGSPVGGASRASSASARRRRACPIRSPIPRPANEYAGWQILVAAVNGDQEPRGQERIAQWLEKNDGRHADRPARLHRQVAYQTPRTCSDLRQLQGGQWVSGLADRTTRRPAAS